MGPQPAEVCLNAAPPGNPNPTPHTDPSATLHTDPSATRPQTASSPAAHGPLVSANFLLPTWGAMASPPGASPSRGRLRVSVTPHRAWHTVGAE